jgi:agmatine deiminase
VSKLRLPAEWEPHAATWIAWPHEAPDWPGKFEPVEWVYGEFCRIVSRGELVRVLVRDEAAGARARRVCQGSGAVMRRMRFHVCPTDRSWTRDYCPLFRGTAAGKVEATVWNFNGWAKYDNWERDRAAGVAVARLAAREPVAGPLVLEGGAIDVNGQGTMLATEECLLSRVQARNPRIGREEHERIFAEHFGVRKVIWLGKGIVGDDTHGHVDDLARFVDPRTVVLVTESDPRDSNHARLAENLERLAGARDQDGRRIRVVPLPMPRPVRFDGQRLPASYANFYIANAAVVVPTFNDPADREALSILARLFPDREVVGIHCRDLVLGLGTLHCMTMQQPA